jgi:hypothetical protein
MPLFRPRRIAQQAGRYAMVDTIPFKMPVQAVKSAALVAAFPIDARKAEALLEGNEVHPLRLWNKGLLIITVVDYRETNIGKYVEYTIGIACTHGHRPAPRLLPVLLGGLYGTGAWVTHMPVSSLISVKGGLGIWGMPKHQANLNFIETDKIVSSQYDVDGHLAAYLEIKRPRSIWLPVAFGSSGYSSFRGLLTRSTIYLKGKAGLALFKKGSARFVLGDSPRVAPLHTLDIGSNPVVIMYFPQVTGVLDDHFETWFVSHAQPPAHPGAGLEEVVNLPLSQDWLPPPSAPIPGKSIFNS